MGNVIRKYDAASCGHLVTGSIDVFVNSRGASRVFRDVAGGLVLGPGVPTVLVNGFPISLRGDNVQGHSPFVPPHNSPNMTGGSNNVLAG